MGQPITKRLLSSALVNATANVTGAWFKAGADWDKATVTYRAASATGVPDLLVYLQLYYGDAIPAAAETDYVTVNIGAPTGTGDDGVRYRVMPTEFLGRCRWARAYVDGQALNAVDTTIDVWVTV